MKCFECGQQLVESRETVRDHRLGLDNVVLQNVPVRRCKKCGTREIMYPQIASLHKLIANVLIHKKTRLTGNEVRFLRKYLGWSSADLARRLAVAPATVSRWENAREPIGVVPDRAIRLMVTTRQPVASYPIEDFLDALTTDEPQPTPLEVEVEDTGYRLLSAS